MNQEMRGLVRLQDLMLAIDAVAEKIAAIPSEVARLEKDLLAAQGEVEAKRAALVEMQKSRRKLEIDLAAVEQKITKYQGQLLDVKTNKEYQTMLHEIETCRADRAALDEKILIEMEEAEKRNVAVKALDDRLKEKRRATDEGKKRLDGTLSSLRGEQERLEAERKTLASSIPADYLDPFMKVARQRKGIALVAVREELCGGCHVRVMPKLIQQVRRATGLIACDSCKRWLYVPEDAAPGQAPGATPGAQASEPTGR
ncbi:MAG TPA: C4-type zinc ribbon domain-containing protein [Candidatus Polarisedimenticolia bacterium]|nr:C4-type zinc ribbon domain-containing protein [Candidatus Polarisedimenticolia bacterium]